MAWYPICEEKNSNNLLDFWDDLVPIGILTDKKTPLLSVLTFLVVAKNKLSARCSGLSDKLAICSLARSFLRSGCLYILVRLSEMAVMLKAFVRFTSGH